MTPSQVANLLMAGGGLFDSKPVTPGRGWVPLPVEEVRAELPQFEITELVSRGGMGAVYRGTQRALKRDVAVKILPPEMRDGAADMQFVERFKQEAQAMARLSHPNIVAVFDAGETNGGLLYFAMEYVEGEDLARLIARDGALPADKALEIARAVCSALAFAHEEGIVHRDIKPSNIMIDRRGRVKVADFGLAKTVEMEGTVMTRSDVGMGSPDFAAPELRVPGVKADGRADLYALGVVLYQMLTGTIPRGRFDLPSGVIPRCHKALDAIVERAMQSDPERRYQTAAEMGKDLDRAAALSGGAGMARNGKVLGGRRLRVLAGGVVLAALIAAGVNAVRNHPADAREHSTDKRPGISHTNAGQQDSIPDPLIDPNGRRRFPVGVWTRLHERAKDEREVPANPKNKMDGPWMLLEDVGYGWYEHEVTPMTNAGMRARFRGQRVNQGQFPQMNLRALQGKRPSVNLLINAGKIQIRTTEAGYPVLAEAPLREPLVAGKEYSMEFYAIGRRLIARVNGQSLTAETELAPLPGNPGIFGSNMDWFRDVEVINLDGLDEAEAMEAAGLR